MTKIVSHAVFESQRKSDASFSGSMKDIAKQWAKTLGPRKRNSRYTVVDGHTVLKQNMYSLQDGEPSVFKREAQTVTPEAVAQNMFVSRTQRAGRDYNHQDWCQICADGGSLVMCDWCPCAYHLSCLGVKEVSKFNWSCPHHQCKTCGRKADAVGGLLFRCEVCPAAFCEDDLPQIARDNITNTCQRFVELGQIHPKQACFVLCSEACIKYHTTTNGGRNPFAVFSNDPKPMSCPKVSSKAEVPSGSKDSEHQDVDNHSGGDSLAGTQAHTAITLGSGTLVKKPSDSSKLKTKPVVTLSDKAVSKNSKKPKNPPGRPKKNKRGGGRPPKAAKMKGASPASDASTSKIALSAPKPSATKIAVSAPKAPTTKTAVSVPKVPAVVPVLKSCWERLQWIGMPKSTKTNVAQNFTEKRLRELINIAADSFAQPLTLEEAVPNFKSELAEDPHCAHYLETVLQPLEKPGVPVALWSGSDVSSLANPRARREKIAELMLHLITILDSSATQGGATARMSMKLGSLFFGLQKRGDQSKQKKIAISLFLAFPCPFFKGWTESTWTKPSYVSPFRSQLQIQNLRDGVANSRRQFQKQVAERKRAREARAAEKLALQQHNSILVHQALELVRNLTLLGWHPVMYEAQRGSQAGFAQVRLQKSVSRMSSTMSALTIDEAAQRQLVEAHCDIRSFFRSPKLQLYVKHAAESVPSLTPAQVWQHLIDYLHDEATDASTTSYPFAIPDRLKQLRMARFGLFRRSSKSSMRLISELDLENRPRNDTIEIDSTSPTETGRRWRVIHMSFGPSLVYTSSEEGAMPPPEFSFTTSCSIKSNKYMETWEQPPGRKPYQTLFPVRLLAHDAHSGDANDTGSCDSASEQSSPDCASNTDDKGFAASLPPLQVRCPFCKCAMYLPKNFYKVPSYQMKTLMLCLP